MWRQRFGLDAPALERAKRCLAEPSVWTLRDEDGFVCCHHDVFPEFTLKAASAEGDHLDSAQEWTRGEIRTDNNHAGWYELRCHQTLLRRIHYVSFDDRNKCVVAPDWEAVGRGRFYFYKADSVRYAVQRFWTEREGRDDSKGLRVRGQGESATEARSRWRGRLDIPVLNPGELEGFSGRASRERHRCRQTSWRAGRGVRTLPPESAGRFDDWRRARQRPKEGSGLRNLAEGDLPRRGIRPHVTCRILGCDPALGVSPRR